MYLGQASGTKPWNSVTRTNGTDNAIVRFDGTLGEVQNSNVFVDDNGNLGVGTSTPSKTLHAKSSNTTVAQIESTSTSSFVGLVNSATQSFIGTKNDGSFAIQTSGSSYSDKLVVDPIGNVGIGNAPKGWYSSYKAIDIGAGGIIANAVTHAELQNCYIDSTGTYRYTATGPASMTFHNGGYYAVRTAASGNAGDAITWVTALQVPITGGIVLPNTSISSATILDWYEEGTFTPVVIGMTTTGVGTYTTQLGKYTRIGNRVDVQVSLNITAHTGTGTMRINGLPFTSASGAGYEAVNICDNANLTATGVPFSVVPGNSTQIWLFNMSSTGVGSYLNIDTSFILTCSFTYFV